MVPWWIKIPAKIVLARLPMGYSLWRKLRLFRHGAMVNPEYALNVFKRHFKAASADKLRQGFTALELGPGDSILSAMLVKAHGGTLCYLVDSGDFADKEVETYKNAASHYKNLELLDIPPAKELTSFKAVLDLTGAKYLTEGIVSLRGIPNASVDFIWSQAVLEHIDRDKFVEHFQEMRRIIHDNGVCSHRIDLKDHLSGGLNNLRFSERVWESNLFSRSGFYTNRIRFAKQVKIFEDAGFSVDVTSTDTWDHLPIPRQALHKDWTNLSEKELCVSGFDVLLRPV
jgi:SAM-dependent methyltransferase